MSGTAEENKAVVQGSIARLSDKCLLPSNRTWSTDHVPRCEARESNIVSVSIGAVGTADVPEYTRTYFPGSTNPAEAQFVTLAQGDRVGVDVPLARTRTALVSGRIYSADGEPSTGGHVELRPSARSTSAAVSIPVGARILPGGAFEFPNVPPGEYVVEADRGRSNQSAEGEFGTTLVTVGDTNVTNIVVQMSAGSSIAGRFTFDTNESTKRPMRSAVELSAVGVDSDHTPSRVASAAIGDDWTFAMTGSTDRDGWIWCVCHQNGC